ncbi:MAG TPA: hypothetical protein VK727_19185 [Steroidobacteraceae bacterium]|jgi:hypothetical protein|nr:hypothetical protein [Steroidobacteraceae bacterium]
MTTERISALGHAGPRRNAVWPWLVMPAAILAVFLVLHNVRRTGGPVDQDSSLGSGIP